MFGAKRFALNTKVCEAIVFIYSIVASPMSASSQNGVIGVSDFFKGEESEASTDADRCSRRQHAVAPQVMHRRVVPASSCASKH
jgi:hypothetical protein